ncbi:lysozyme inhibitor LprI family protein [Granulosicoccus antarcticus]|uniref:Lysozyme inhibitor LprI-like N-terminal domain-containing protein n=1 Tax=Granulosicoccus antarcticus IMCC3135 TaxID=1192854 RepID=A0A2Z2NYU2_9GAMM|nr:lysozyme inhibitor LprI family protein [Granulosicoccus antarcticus]ASJ76489.1 hypothetical protein IMCC3135_32220 [Granulosicoccus antarcticus IMCC3135]
MAGRGLLVTLVVFVLLLVNSGNAQAQSYDALVECTALSAEIDDIHICMDNYLDLMDDSMSRITEFLAESLSGEALGGLGSSQQAFKDYRRQNCLWYLNFSSPRQEAEQIAKNCLAHMSQQRLQELQSLARTEDTTGQVLRGFYVYGAERNSFQLCGSDERYWLEGEASLVGQAQQQYLNIVSSDLQVLYGAFAGTVDAEAQAPQGHQGVFDLAAIIELRVPTESDCRLPGETASTAFTAPAISAPTTVASTDSPVAPDPDSAEFPEEQLTAYFGAWLVDCTQTSAGRNCELNVRMVGPLQAPKAAMTIVREKAQRTSLEVTFDGREIDSPSRILWQVDSSLFGDIVGSEIRVDQSGTRQLVPASGYLAAEILPKLVRGTAFSLEVLASVDDDAGERYTGTLIGLTKAMAFADGFIRDGSS